MISTGLDHKEVSHEIFKNPYRYWCRDIGYHADLPAGASVIDFGAELDERNGVFMDTAAVMQTLDLIITSDTAIAHLAGALGVAVWLVLPHVPEWRWLMERDDSPWYPTMRLFRQTNPGDWATAFDHISDALKKLVCGYL